MGRILRFQVLPVLFILFSFQHGRARCRSLNVKSPSRGVFVSQEGIPFQYEMTKGIHNGLEIWVDVANKMDSHLKIQDPMSAAVLNSLKNNDVCLVAPKTTLKGYGGSCFRIGLRDLTVVSSILTQCDGKIILPLESSECLNEGTFGHNKKSYSFEDNLLNRRKRDIFGFFRKIVDKAVNETVKAFGTSEGVGKILAAGEKIKKTADSILSSVKNSDIGQTLQSAGNAFENTAKDVLKTIETSEVGQAVQSAGDTMKNTADGIISTVQNSDVGHTLKSAGKSLKTTAEDAFNSVRASEVGDAVRSAGETVKNAADGVITSIKNANIGQTIKNTAEDAISSIKNANIGQTIKNTAEDAISSIKSSAVGQAVQSAGNTLKSEAESAFGVIKDKVNEASTAVKNSDIGREITDAAKSLRTEVEGAIDSAKQSKLGEELINAKNKIGSSVSEASSFVENSVREIGDRLTKKEGSATEGANESPNPNVSQV